MPLNYTTNLGPLNRLKSELALKVRRRFFDLFMREFSPGPNSMVADFGITGHRNHPVHYFFEFLYPYKDKIHAIGQAAEGANWFPEQFPGIRYIEADLRHIPLPDNYFDAGICNAVLEHAGTLDDQKMVVSEICRVARNILFTTPNKWFPLEVHTFLPFFHYLPDRIYRPILKSLGFEYFADIKNLNLLDAKTLLSLFPSNRKNRIVNIGFPILASNLVCISSMLRRV